MAQTPVFQKNGPYAAYTARHKALRLKENYLLMVLVLPALAYFLTENGLFMVAGLVYLAVVLFYSRKQKKKLFHEYTLIEQKNFALLKERFAQQGVEINHSGFGYLETKDSFRPIFLFQCRNTLYIYENPFIKQCVYGIRDQMLYMLDVKEDLAACEIAQLPLDRVEFSPIEEYHQELLRQEAIKWNEYLIIEFPIYQKMFELQMDFGAEKQFLSMNLLLSSIKKEQIFTFSLDEGQRIMVPAHVKIRLGFLKKEES